MNQLPQKTTLDNGRYTIIKVLGKGGFAITYLAYNRLGKKIAIKEFFPDGHANRHTNGTLDFTRLIRDTLQKLKEKFRREGEILLAIEKEQHPNIVKAINLFEDNNTLYLVLEYIDGPSLKTIIDQKGALSVADAKDWILQIGSALSLLHSKQFYHLDIKPSNILINAQGQAVLIDFGLSKHGVGENSNQLTSLAYSFSYAPPEQKDGSGKANPQMDIYAFGATCLFMLTGKVPKETQLSIQIAQLRSPIKEALLQATEYKVSSRPKSVYTFLEKMGLSDDTKRTVYVSNAIESKTAISQRSQNSVPKIAYGLFSVVLLIIAVLFLKGMIPTNMAEPNPVEIDTTLLNPTLPTDTSKGISETPEEEKNNLKDEKSESNSNVNRGSEKYISPEKVSMTSFKGNISSTYRGVAQTIQLAIKKVGKTSNGLDKIIGNCIIRDATDTSRYIKLSLSGTYDKSGKRLFLSSGQRLDGKNLDYCNFDLKSSYEWNTTELEADFLPKRNLRDRNECDNLKSSAKVQVTRI